MIFLIVTLLCIIFAVYIYFKDSDLAAPPVFIGIVSSIILFMMIWAGISDYPILLGKQSRALSLQSEIENIKKCNYTNVRSGYLVGGTLDNMSQSKAVTEFVSTYAQSKADFNSNLSKIKAYKNSWAWIILLDGAFISSDVLKMSEIK